MRHICKYSSSSYQEVACVCKFCSERHHERLRVGGGREGGVWLPVPAGAVPVVAHAAHHQKALVPVPLQGRQNRLHIQIERRHLMGSGELFTDFRRARYQLPARDGRVPDARSVHLHVVLGRWHRVVKVLHCSMHIEKPQVLVA